MLGEEIGFGHQKTLHFASWRERAGFANHTPASWLSANAPKGSNPLT
jgi:hypothetical protein